MDHGGRRLFSSLVKEDMLVIWCDRLASDEIRVREMWSCHRWSISVSFRLHTPLHLPAAECMGGELDGRKPKEGYGAPLCSTVQTAAGTKGLSDPGGCVGWEVILEDYGKYYTSSSLGGASAFFWLVGPFPNAPLPPSCGGKLCPSILLSRTKTISKGK